MHRVQAVLQKLQSYHPKNIDLGLHRSLRLLEKCGSPHKNLPPVIHIAGTNGKGSTLSFLQAIFESAGVVVHRYTSPELVSFNERFIVSGAQVSDADLLYALQFVDTKNNGDAITFFEITTVAGFYLFAHHPADVLLLETGLGGRLDSTNVVSNPLCTIIANMGYDHQHFLGDTIEKIATEKAGIFRKSVPAIIAPQTHAQAYVALEHSAKKIGAMYAPVPSINRTATGFYMGDTAYPRPNLIGNHQYDNGATAIYAVLYLQQNGMLPFTICDSDLHMGLTTAIHRGRFETVFVGGVKVYLDGGHNADAGQCLAHTLHAQNIKQIPLVCGMLQGKDISGFITPLRPYISTVYTVPVSPNPFATADGMDAVTLAEKIQHIGISATACPSVSYAIKSANTPEVLCAGSLHLVGDVLKIGADTDT